MTQPYEVKEVAVIAKGPALLVREFTFAPGESTPWHRHSAVSDLCYGLTGAITIEMREPDERVVLAPSQRCAVPAGRVHRVLNAAAGDGRMLLVQHGGAYDFLPVD